jgi:hypothetical protein
MLAAGLWSMSLQYHGELSLGPLNGAGVVDDLVRHLADS